jgi:Zn-dependent oligopeptidase
MTLIKTRAQELTAQLSVVRGLRLYFCTHQPKWNTFKAYLDAWACAQRLDRELAILQEARALSHTDTKHAQYARNLLMEESLIESCDLAFRRQLWSWVHSPNFQTLSISDQTIVRSTLSGTLMARWTQHKQKAWRENMVQQQTLEQQFSFNLQRDQSSCGVHVETLGSLRHLPLDLRQKARANAQAKGLVGYWFEASRTHVQAFRKLTALPSALKRQMTMMYRLVGRTPYQQDTLGHNAVVLSSLAALKREEANLHQEKHYASYAWTGNVFTSPRSMSTFLKRIYSAVQEAPITANVSEKMKAYKQVHCHPEHAFAVLQTLLFERFELTFKQVASSKWLSDVPRFLVKHKHKRLGYVILDLFERPTRPPTSFGGFMIDHTKRYQFADGRVQLPTSYLFLNAKSKHFSHQDCAVLFHEMGHVLHHLGCTSTSPTANWDDIERDACEWPSLLLERWAWEPAVTQRLFSSRSARKITAVDLHTRKASMQTGLQVGWLDLKMHSSAQARYDHPHTWVERASPYIPQIKELLMEDWVKWEHLMLMNGTYTGYLWSELLAHRIQGVVSRGEKTYASLWSEVFTNDGTEYAKSLLETWSPGVTVVDPTHYLTTL